MDDPKLPPHSDGSEAGVLGCLLLSPKDCIPECIEAFKGNDPFYAPQNSIIYAALLEMWEANKPIDVMTVAEWLKSRSKIEDVGGLAYIAQLPDSTPSAANLEYFCGIVYDNFVRRNMIRTCTEITAKAYKHEGEIDALVDEAEKSFMEISNSRITGENKSMKVLVRDAVSAIQMMFDRKGQLTGIPTGFIDLDKMTGGLQNGDMILIGARPSMGKTSLAMNIAEHAAVETKIPVGVFSLEMTAESLVMRMLCSHSRVNLRNVRDGFMSERDFPRMVASTGKLSNASLFIDDTPGLSILQLRAKARRMHQQYGIKLFVIDYLQLLHSTASRGKENRQQEVSDISSGIKALAKELRVPIIVLSQLNRELEKDKERKPRLSDIRESGSVEQDADLIGLLYKPNRGENEEESQDVVPVNLLIAKQRNGPTGDVCLTFLKQFTRFESAAKISHEDIPRGASNDDTPFS